MKNGVQGNYINQFLQQNFILFILKIALKNVHFDNLYFVFKLERFYFDVEVGSCVSFLFSGCEGNENNFLALSDCSQFCSNVTIKQESDVCFF